jgi:hypothetical protein
METSGDMMFLWLVFMLAKRETWIEENFYTWKYNENSVTRSSPFYSIATYDKTIQCYSILAEELISRRSFDLLGILVSTVFGMIYVDITHPKWNKVPEEYREIAVKAMRKFISSYLSLYKILDKQCRYEGYKVMVKHTKTQDVFRNFDNIVPWAENFIVNKRG